MRVLIVEDDPSVGASLVDGLALNGFEASWVTTGAEALASADSADVVLLDLGLPDLDGLEVCRRLRSVSDVPIVVLSARTEELDRILSLERGADDHLVKPISLRELVARLHALERRMERLGGSDRAGDGTATVEVGRLRLDPRTRTVTVDGEPVDLTPKEHDLLAALLADPGAVRTREELMDEVWDEHWFGSTKTLNVHVASLRSKLGDPAWIATVRGVGFRLVDPDADPDDR
ncbi:response regulator transcription factor [Nitriliruptor alkaliphilus]|uniref:response regulator transcription factor n=1 Tax=Nitriliruptor alkaliphilus TaxID=427918 RepID=UPI0006974A4D|nr:response regulator transcription factor [Nitriliruptor alkaliphilus]